MSRREPILPLVIAAAVSVTLHAGLMPLASQWLAGTHPRRTQASPNEKSLQPVLPDPEKITLGQDAPGRSTVAWISHEDFRKLTAPQSLTEQPSLQQQVDPTPNAPTPIDPTPPSPLAQTVRESLAAAQSTPPATAAEKPSPSTPRQPRGVTPPTTDPTVVPPSPANPPAQPTPPTPTPSPTASRPASPTSAARTDKEASPTTLETGHQAIQPGGVLTGQGIEIKTVQPRFSVITRVSVMPHNPIAKVVFDHHDGRVIKAELVRSSGYPNVDGPVLASLYRWRAAGKRLAQLKQPLTVQIELILVDQ